MPHNQMVYVIDDDDAVRATIRTLCKSIGMSVEEYASIRDFEAANVPEYGGCILLDLRMPRLGGLPGVQHVRSIRPQLPVIVMSGHADVRTAVQAMKAGAVDFFEKPFGPQELLDSVQNAIAAAPQAQVPAELTIRLELLTTQQRRILERLSMGQTEEAIASEMDLHLKSVQRHRKNAVAKLGLKRGEEGVLRSLLA
jgi:FixJ family two-component response regulator